MMGTQTLQSHGRRTRINTRRNGATLVPLWQRHYW